MKILLLTDADVYAGTEAHIFDLASALTDLGHHATIACPVPAPLAAKAADAGIPVLAVAKRRMPDFAAIATLAAELRSGRADIIHAHNGRTHLLAVAAMKRAGRGHVVATQHFLAPNRTGRRGPKAWLAGRLHHWAEHNTAAFVAISNAVRDAMLARHDAPAEKITVVHNGIREAAPAAASMATEDTEHTEYTENTTNNPQIDTDSHRLTTTDLPSRCVGINSEHEDTKDQAAKETEARKQKTEDDDLATEGTEGTEAADALNPIGGSCPDTIGREISPPGSMRRPDGLNEAASLEALKNKESFKTLSEAQHRVSLSEATPNVSLSEAQPSVSLKPPQAAVSLSEAPLRVIFCAARLQKEKDIPTLIKAFALISSKTKDRRSQINNVSPPAASNSIATEHTEATEEKGSEALQNSPNSQLLTPNSSSIAAALLIAGEGDQRSEIEKLIESMFTDHRSQINNVSPAPAASNSIATEHTEIAENTTNNPQIDTDSHRLTTTTDSPSRCVGINSEHEGTKDQFATEATEGTENTTNNPQIDTDLHRLTTTDSPSRCVGINSEHEGTKDQAAKETEARKQKTEDDGLATEDTEAADALNPIGGSCPDAIGREISPPGSMRRPDGLNETASLEALKNKDTSKTLSDAPHRVSLRPPQVAVSLKPPQAAVSLSEAQPSVSLSGAPPAGREEDQQLRSSLPPLLITHYSLLIEKPPVRLLGFRRDVAALMAACDIFVLPCPVEGFGLVLIEAMAMGKPVIAANAGGPRDIVVHGETGLLFEPGNPQSLAAAMAELLNHPQKAKAMGAAGRKRFEDHFTAARMAAQIAAIYGAAAAAQ